MIPTITPELAGLELVLLARASGNPKPTTAQLAQAAILLRRHGEPVSDARRASSAALFRLRQRALLTELRSAKARPARSKKGRAQVSRLKSSARWALTSEGIQVLRQVFAVAAVPAWPALRDRYMPALGLGLKPATREASKALATTGAIVANVLAPSAAATPTTSVNDLCDALLAKALGLPAKQFSLLELRAHVLARHLGVDDKQVPRSPKALRDLAEHAAANDLQLRAGSDRNELRAALSRRWLHREPPDQPVLLKTVEEALSKVGGAGRFGTEKVFISALWSEVARHRELHGMSIEDFKRWLVDANREQVLDLVRADLVGAMDPHLVTESEIEDLGATFHFVVDRQAAARRSSYAENA